MARWLPFLQFIVMMQSDMRMKNIYDDMHESYGLDHTTVGNFKILHFDCLKRYVEEVGGVDIGGKGAMTAADETTMSKDIPTSGKPNGFKPKQRGKFSRRNPRLQKSLPGRTLWKGHNEISTAALKRKNEMMERPAALKRPAAHKKPAATRY